MKKALLIFLVILLALITALFFITFESPGLKDFLVAKAQDELGCKIEIEKLTVNLLRGVRIENVALYLRQEPDQKPLLKAADFYLKHKLLESLIRRKLIIDEVALSEPAIFIDENSLSHLRVGTGEQAPKREGEEESRISLLISKIVITNGWLTLKDKKAGTELDLKEIDLRAGDFSLDNPFEFSLNIGRQLKAEGEANIDKKDVKAKVLCKEFDLTTFKPYLPANLDVKNLSATLEAELVQANKFTLQGNGQLSGISFVQSPLTIQNEMLSLDCDLTADLLAKKIMFNHLKAATSSLGVETSCSATIEDFERIEATITSSLIRLEQVGKIVRPGISTDLDKTDIRGLVSLQTKLTGSLTDLAGLSYEGQAELKEVTIRRKELPGPINISGQVGFNRKQITIERLTVSATDDLRLNISGKISKPTTEPAFDLRVAGDNLSLTEAAKLLPKEVLSKVSILSGKADLRVTAKGLVKTPKETTLAGQAAFKEVQVKLPPLTKEVRLSGSCKFSQEEVSTEDLTGKLGRSDFSLLATVRDLQGSPKANFSLSSNLTDLDELLSAYKEVEEKSGPSSKESTPEEKINLTASGKVDIQELIYQKEPFKRVRAQVKFADNRLEITSLNLNLYNGSLTGQGALTLKETPAYEFKGRIENVAVNGILSHLTSVKDQIFGQLATDISLSGEGFSSEAIRKSLSMSCDLKVNDGKLAGKLPLTEGLVSLLGISQKKEIPYKDLRAKIKIEDGAIKTEDLGLKSQEVNILASGEASLAGKLNFQGKFDLSKDLADKISGDLAGFLKDKEGRINIPYELGGTFSHPKFKLMTKGIKEEIKQKYEEEAKEKIGEETKKLFDKFRK